MRYKRREEQRSETNYREIRLYSVQAVRPFFYVEMKKNYKNSEIFVKMKKL